MIDPDSEPQDELESEAALGEQDEEPTEEEPTEEELADRRRRADRATRGALAAILCLEALVVLLMPRAIAQTAAGLGTTKTLVLVALALVMIATAFILRRPWGIGAGGVLQLLFLGTAIFLPAALVASVLLVGVWLYLLNLRHQIVGTPGGARMLIS